MQRLPIDDARWHDFVTRHPDATPFHDPAWASLLAECYGMSGFVLAELGESGSVTGGIPLLAPPRLPGAPRRLVSLPYTDSLPPLVPPDGARQVAEAVDAARSELGVARVELRGELAGALADPPAAVMHMLTLERDPDAIARRFSQEKRRNIRASERNGLTTSRAENERDLTETYYGLHLQTRRRLGVPSQPKRFFRLLWRRLLEPGRGFVLTVRHGNIPIASAVFLVGNGTVVYKYGASDAARQAHKPNDLLMWTAIRDACLEGFERFDFGRSELTATGLRQFKSRWGAVERPLVYSTIGESGARGSQRGGPTYSAPFCGAPRSG